MEQTDSGQRGGGGGMVERRGISQRTCTNDPWTWTMVWGWTVGVGKWAGQRRTKGKKLGQL